MKNTIYISLALAAIIAMSSGDLSARGGRGGGARGGGAARGGGGRVGGGAARSMPSRSPSMSRPAARPSPRSSAGTRPGTRPSVGTRPGTRPNTGVRPGSRPGTGTRPGSRPNTGTRPSTGPFPETRPTQGQLSSFLNPSTGRRGDSPTTRPWSGGGAAGDFLQNRTATEQRPAAGQFSKVGTRPSTRPAIDPTRPRSGDRLAGNRPGRVDDRGLRQEHRQTRRDEVRNQYRVHHPLANFWHSHPSWARWQWNRPYRWATWAAVTGWFPWGWNQQIAYSYGDNVYYEGDTVYYGDDAIATAAEYTDQAQAIAESAPEVDDAVEWMSLGVFAVVQDGQETGPPPTLFLQLAVNKQGIVGGTFSNTTTDSTQSIEGMVDKKSQRSAWTITGKKWPLMETGISNLTQDTAPVLLHFEDGQTQQWLLVRMEEPKE